MKVTLYDYKGTPYEVEVPDDTTELIGETISGDEILISPVHFDTGRDTRIADYYDGTWKRILVNGEWVNDNREEEL